MHTVQLTGLQPSTRYFYRSVTSDLVSQIYDFITPPDPDSESSFKIAAMSDMQKDYSNFNKFQEIPGSSRLFDDESIGWMGGKAFQNVHHGLHTSCM